MNAPAPSSSHPRPTRRGGLSYAATAVITVGAVVATLLFGGLCAGLIYWAIPTVEATLILAGVPVTVPNVDPNDWMADYRLAPIYTAALDAAVTNQEVIDRLGEDVGIDLEATSLYRRTNTGQLDLKGETIEFEIVGAKETATVMVVSTGVGGDSVHIAEITVILDDNTTLDVPPPKDQESRIR